MSKHGDPWKEVEELKSWKEEQIKKIEEWTNQHVKLTNEILWLNDCLKDSEEEVYFWRNQYIEMIDRATKWKHRFFAMKGIRIKE